MYEESNLDDRRFIVHPVTGTKRKHFSEVVRTRLDQMFSRGIASAMERCGERGRSVLIVDSGFSEELPSRMLVMIA